MPADAPRRATSSATLTHGVALNIPVQFFAGAEQRSDRFVKRSEYTRDGRSVGRAPIVRETEPPELADSAEIVRCVETEYGLVELTDDEIKEAMALPEEEAEIITFLPLHVMGSGRYMPESLMQVRPAKGKKRGTYNPAAAKAFTALMKAMRQSQLFALVQLNLRGLPAYGALLPTGRLYRLLFDDEVRADLPLPDVQVTIEDVEHARQAMQVSATPPELTNRHRELLLTYVDKKAKEGGTLNRATTPEPEPDEDALLAKVRDAVEGEP